ncbi:MAG: cobalamin biosynthesis protein [Pseudomonadota bacterium]
MKVAGLGFRDGAPLVALRAALGLVEQAGGPASALATVTSKAGAAALNDLAIERGLVVLAVPVAGVPTPTRSSRVRALFGTGSVAEAAALAAAGPGARLIVGRVTSPDGMATCAMALSNGSHP